MTTQYHRNIQRVLLDVGGRFPGKVERVFNDKRPMHINHPTKNESIAYYPDTTYQTRSGKAYVFEVMDSEATAQALVIAHVLEGVLAPQIGKVFFIVQSVSLQKKVEHITRTVLAKLEDLSDGRIGRGVRFYYVVVSSNDAKSHDRLAKIFAKVLAAAWGHLTRVGTP